MTVSNVPTDASVLLGFRASNVRSFRDELNFSLVAMTRSEPDRARMVHWRENGKPIGVLPVAVAFGANASGKTNLLRAMHDMRSLVLHSFRRWRPDGGLPQRPFKLDAESAQSPTTFEIELVLRGVRHEYGFTFDRDKVVEEWAYRFPRGRGMLIFHREGDDVEFGSAERAKSRATGQLLRSNALFLSTAAATEHPLLTPLYLWFVRNLWLADARSRSFRQAHTARLLDDAVKREVVLSMLRAADLGISGAKLHEIDEALKERLERAAQILAGEEEEGPSIGEVTIEFEESGVRLAHHGPHGDVELDPDAESLGTLVWFGLIGPVVDALKDGSVLLADEIDASLHPDLVERLVALFQSSVTNPNRAQLIFNSHDSTLLGDATQERLVGRDQVWFTEKNQDGGSRLYPLTDLDPRKDEALGRRYRAGRYGARPILSAGEFELAARLAAETTPA